MSRVCLVVACVLCFVGAEGMGLGDDEAMSFIAIGDWGGQPDKPYTTPRERSVAKQMEHIAAKINATFIMALGDNFYEDGISDEYDKRFSETFEAVFVTSALQVPWYLVAGNHDHRQNVSGQIAYSRHSARWVFPDYFYSKTISVAGIKLQLLMIDTVVLCGTSGVDDDGLQPQGPDDVQFAEDHWEWIEKQLRSSKADYLLVAGHYPVWSVGHHGPTHCLVDRLRPMLRKYQATAYVCGHDHNLQHLKEDDSPVEYILTGAANKIDASVDHRGDVPHNAGKFFWASDNDLGGFSVFNVGKASMTMTFVSGDGETLYKLLMQPRQQTA